jgi:phenylacetate-coenzyme A ligase PaaK-like adenylate-forming protein
MAERTYQELASDAAQRTFDVLLPALDRLSWGADQLAAHRRAGLAATLAHAAERSPWHATRLTALDVDVDLVDPGDLAGLPTMSKGDLMAHWDDIVTDERLDLATARAHLARLDAGGPAALLDEYHVLTTGGSTGEPGVFCWSLAETLVWGASVMRFTAAAGFGPPLRTAWVGARSLRHPSAALAVLNGVLAGNPATTELCVPIDQPVAAIVARLNELQPDSLWVVSSVLPALVEAAQRGALRIDVDRISVGSDVLDPAAATAAAETFEATVLEGYPTTDVGHIAQQAPGERGLYINDDLLIVEPVDEHDHPVEPGEWSDHLLVTSLHHRTLPLIRYRIDDRVRLDPEAGERHPGFRRIAAIDGRTDDLFHYGDVTVHPHVFRTVLSRHSAIKDFQVHQTATGADVQVIVAGHLDPRSLTTDLQHALVHAGLTHPHVTVTRIDQPTRTPVGKRLRFVPDDRPPHSALATTPNVAIAGGAVQGDGPS